MMEGGHKRSCSGYAEAIKALNGLQTNAAVLEKVDGDGTNWKGKVEKMEAEEREEKLKEGANEKQGKTNSIDTLIEYNEESEN